MSGPGGATIRTKKQQAAYDQIKYKRRTGEIPKVAGHRCSKCGAPATESAHSDYSKPMSIRYMCASCNRKEGHAKNR